MNDATRLCARLLRAGALLRSEMPGLDLPEVRREVERRLRGVGLVLATSPYSDHVGTRLAPEMAADPAFEAASNLGLRADACALLVVLWVRLVLPLRQAGGGVWDSKPQVRLDILARELRPLLGDRRRIRTLVAQLRRLSFLAGQGEVIEAGPLLELGIDGDRMIAFLRGGVLAGLLKERERPERGAKGDEGRAGALFAAQVLEVLRRLGGSAGMTELVRETGAPASRLRMALRILAQAGQVRRSGERRSTRYHLGPLGLAGPGGS
jgi:DNA-binding transcriptional ArsR family regulator